MPLKTLILAAFALAAPAAGMAGVCTPTAATLCVGVDDYADVWINGQCVATCAGTDFAYVDNSTAGPITCVSIDPAILSATGANYMAVRVRNTSPTEMWGTWALDITCSNGGHSYLTSNDAFQFYDDPSGTNPPAVDGSGNPWTSPAYLSATAWGSPTQVNGTVYGKRAIDPQTGLQLPPMSWDSNGDGPNGTEVMYFRQGFQLTPVPTPLPAALSLSVTASVCAAQSGTSFNFNVTLCNSGGNTLSPTTAVLTLDPKLSFCGPYSNPAGATVSNSGGTVTITWPTFGGATCGTVAICAVDYYIGPPDVGYVTNTGYSFSGPNSGGAGGVSVPLVNCVVLSPTPSPVPSPSPSVSPTYTDSPTPAAPSPTPTVSPSFTVTPSLTFSPTASPSATVSLTSSVTLTPPPPTPSVTATPAPPHLTLSPYAPNPDPASSTVWIPYLLSTAATVDIKVFDVSGELVRSLAPVAQPAGVQEQSWDLKNTAKSPVASGVYLCRIHAEGGQSEAATVWVKAAVAR